MRKRAAVASVVAATAPAATVATKKREHVPGCATVSCDKRIGRAWWREHHPKPRARMALAVASWYGPGLYGNHLACGGTLTPGSFGVAHKALACGTKIRLCVRRCVTAPVIDRGPYVGGRTFDLTAPVRDAVGMAGVATVRYRVVGCGC